MGDQPQQATPTAKESLTEYRREMVINGLLIGKSRRQLSKELGVSRWAISKWLDTDTVLLKRLEEKSKTLYEDALDEIIDIAFSNTRASASTKFEALKLIKTEYEGRIREITTGVTMEDTQRILSRLVSALGEYPEAKQAVIDAFTKARREHISSDRGPGDVPADEPDQSTPGT